MDWPDVVAVLVIGFATWRGWTNGFVREITGFVAMAAAAAAAFVYNGSFDQWMGDRTHLSPGPSHALGVAAFCALAYALVTIAGYALRNVAKLPVIKQFNELGGAAIGGAKWVAFLWLALYVGLFFPLPGDVRASLHSSVAVAFLQIPNAALDTTLRHLLPAPIAPFAGGIFDNHHV